MALTFTKYASGVHGDQRYWQGLITFDSSYPTGGEAVAAANFQMNSIECISVTPVNLGQIGHWDQVNSKVKLSANAGGAEVANESDQSGTSVSVDVHGV